MAVGALSRLAARVPVPVFVVAGGGAGAALLALRADDRLAVAASPRHASVLLVGGTVTGELADVVAGVHDQLPQPRAVVWWGGDEAAAPGIPGTVTVDPAADVVAVLGRLHRELWRGDRPSTPPVGSARNPVPWQGEGPHGQGGEGMMGGRPYGRAMAMTGPDVRDGLELDRLTVPVGPALPGLPPGLTLRLELQGDVVQHVGSADELLADGPHAGAPLPSVAQPFDIATTRPVTIAELERARARYQLLRLADALGLYGLDAAARRVARLGATLEVGDRRRLRRLRAWLRRARPLHGATAGVGRVDADTVGRLGLRGVTARAAGVAVDARDADPAYRAAGFETITRRGGDAHARWLQRADEAEQALDLAAAAGAATTTADGPVEDPRGAGATTVTALAGLLVGCEWGDAVTVIASLDLDPGAMTGAPPATAPEGAP